MRQPRFSVQLTAAQEALLAMEHYTSGLSMAAAARVAIAKYYADHAKTAGYADEVRSIRIRRGEQID